MPCGLACTSKMVDPSWLTKSTLESAGSSWNWSLKQRSSILVSVSKYSPHSGESCNFYLMLQLKIEVATKNGLKRDFLQEFDSYRRKIALLAPVRQPPAAMKDGKNELWWWNASNPMLTPCLYPQLLGPKARKHGIIPQRSCLTTQPVVAQRTTGRLLNQPTQTLKGFHNSDVCRTPSAFMDNPPPNPRVRCATRGFVVEVLRT